MIRATCGLLFLDINLFSVCWLVDYGSWINRLYFQNYDVFFIIYIMLQLLIKSYRKCQYFWLKVVHDCIFSGTSVHITNFNSTCDVMFLWISITIIELFLCYSNWYNYKWALLSNLLLSWYCALFFFIFTISNRKVIQFVDTMLNRPFDNFDLFLKLCRQVPLYFYKLVWNRLRFS
jgi:hypothetical protein